MLTLSTWLHKFCWSNYHRQL